MKTYGGLHDHVLAGVKALRGDEPTECVATTTTDGPSKWLTDALLYVVHLPASHVEEMSLEEPSKTWMDHISSEGSGT